jgi:hypothetical protein
VNDAPKLLVEWSSPWEEFRSAIRPAFSRSAKPLAGEARTQLFPYRGMLASWACEVILLVAIIVLPAKLASMRPYAPPAMPKYDVIYFSGDELPRTEDLAGAQAGVSGRSGGQEARHRTQTIRVARGSRLRDTVVDAPQLKLPESNSAVANLLAFAGKLIPGPAPTEGLKAQARNVPPPDTVVAPSPNVRRENVNPAPALVAQVVPPPVTTGRDMVSFRLPGNQPVTVVPPPVSAPERVTIPNPKLTLPAQLVVAPPPQITREVASAGPGFGPGELHSQVVPPPAQVTGAASEYRNPGSLGNSTIVAPPVQVNSSIEFTRGAIAGLGTPSVVAPPAQVSGTGTDRRNIIGGLGTPDAVAPPVQLAGSTSARRGFGGIGDGASVVPPPPNLAVSHGRSGHGSGRGGDGFGGPLDIGEVAAPPKSGGGSGNGNGIVVSNQPGSAVGVPGKAGTGSLAMSPSGGNKLGLGGSGGGNGIGRGNGSGSGLAGEGSGAGKQGTGHGADLMAKGGISPYPGPGGAGSGSSGSPAVPGVSVRGGSNIVSLPSFDGGGDLNAPDRSRTSMDRHGPGITVVATSRSGGALNMYGALKGDKVYTTYFDTSLGTAVMQFADPRSANHAYADDLTAPEPMRADLPAGLPRSRLVIACVLDQSGLVKNAHVLEAGPSELTTRVLAALSSWKFRPVLRGDVPVEVNAILGFAIDTR